MVDFLRPRVAALGPIKVLAIVIAVLAGAPSFAGPASAQGFGWFGNLFGGGPPRPPAQPRFPGYDQQQDYGRPQRPPRRHASDGARAPRDREPVVRDKERYSPKNASAFVHVLGDSLGQNLASGLDDALADRQDVAVIHAAKGSTGLVATDFYDWPKAVDIMLVAATKKPKSAADPAKGEATKPGADTPEKAVAAKPVVEKPGADPAAKDKSATEPVDPSHIDVAVMMIGSNDRQAIHLDGTTLKPGTSEWTVEYKKRVLAIDEAFRRKGVPLIWVGVPIARDDGFADDMAAFNDIYREAAAKTGAVYVDTWEAFSDDNGDFSAVGPDVDGQITRLRTADGVYFTKAGSRKLAHFVEVHVRRALDGKMARPPVPDAQTLNAPVARKPDVGPISSLTDPPSSHDGKLAAATAYRSDAARDPQIETSIVKGIPQPVPAGRADDLKWPASGTPNP